MHVDASVDDGPFKALLADSVRFINDERRVNVTWASWSQVASTLELMRAASEHMEPNDRLVLLSGDSYPLQSLARVEDFFSENPGTQYINSIAMPSKAMNKPLSRLSRLYIPYNPREAGWHLLPRALNKLGIPRRYRRALAGRPPYAGSNWWALTGDVVSWLLDEVDRDDAFVRFCRWSKMPDEFFFQTLLGTSPFSDRLRPSLMFADFSRAFGPKPAYIDALHIAGLSDSALASPPSGYGHGVALFARKFRTPAETELARSLWESTAIGGATPDA